MIRRNGTGIKRSFMRNIRNIKDVQIIRNISHRWSKERDRGGTPNNAVRRRAKGAMTAAVMAMALGLYAAAPTAQAAEGTTEPESAVAAVTKPEPTAEAAEESKTAAELQAADSVRRTTGTALSSQGSLVYCGDGTGAQICATDLFLLRDKLDSIPDRVFNPANYTHTHQWEYRDINENTHTRHCEACGSASDVVSAHRAQRRENCTITYGGGKYAGIRYTCVCGYQWEREASHTLYFEAVDEGHHRCRCRLEGTKFCSGYEPVTEEHYAYFYEPCEDGCHHVKVCMDCGYRHEEECSFDLPVGDGGSDGDSDGGEIGIGGSGSDSDGGEIGIGGSGSGSDGGEIGTGGTDSDDGIGETSGGETGSEGGANSGVRRCLCGNVEKTDAEDKTDSTEAGGSSSDTETGGEIAEEASDTKTGEEDDGAEAGENPSDEETGDGNADEEAGKAAGDTEAGDETTDEETGENTGGAESGDDAMNKETGKAAGGTEAGTGPSDTESSGQKSGGKIIEEKVDGAVGKIFACGNANKKIKESLLHVDKGQKRGVI